jgi:hypothetical protein
VNDYIQAEELKATLELTGTVFADEDVKAAIAAASRSIDAYCGRRFYPDADANQVRYFTARASDYVNTADLISLTALTFDWDGDNVYELDWTALPTYWMLDPPNAPADGRPYTGIRARGGRPVYSWDYGVIWSGSGPMFPLAEAAIKVTGKFGWATVPDQVKEATGLLASRFLKRRREAPFGIAAIGLDGVGVRIAAQDPDVEMLLRPFARLALVA